MAHVPMVAGPVVPATVADPIALAVPHLGPVAILKGFHAITVRSARINRVLEVESK